MKTDKIGVIIGRFQVHELHPAHKDLINKVIDTHPKVIVFLGVSPVLCSRRNPLDFVTRKEMLNAEYGSKISAILPIHDNRSDDKWSAEIDKRIKEVFPTGSAILYGSRDSFLPHYKGQFTTKEFETKVYFSGTEVRHNVAQEIIASPDFRAGAIYAVYNQYPVVYSCVDVAIVRNTVKPSIEHAEFSTDDLIGQTEILLGRKPNEDKYRFIGGFVDIKDKDDYAACRREAFEETGATVEPYDFVMSMQVDDWRYKNEKDKKIMTRLYLAKYISGPIAPADDIAEIKWFNITESFHDNIVPEHIPLINALLEKIA